MAGLPIRARRARLVWRAMAAILVVGVLLGGVFPVLYGELMPHAHVFLGGAPPPDWQAHDHPNPLFLVLGKPSALASTSASPASTSTTTADSPPPGRVVSIVDGSLGGIFSLLGFALLLPLGAVLLTTAIVTPVRSTRLPPAVGPNRGPAPPPPRLA